MFRSIVIFSYDCSMLRFQSVVKETLYVGQVQLNYDYFILILNQNFQRFAIKLSFVNTRPGTTPYKSIVASRSPSLVKDAKALSIPVQSAGQPLVYQHGEHNVNLPQYTNEVFEGHFTQPENINNQPNAFNFDYNDNNYMDFMNQPNDADSNTVENEQNEMLCNLRLSKLISLLDLNS